MRLKTKLVIASTIFATGLTVALSSVFFFQLLNSRFAQAQAANDVLVQQLILSARNALQTGLANAPPVAPGEAAFEQAVASALQHDTALQQAIDAIVLYSPTVQDVYISAANGHVLVASNPMLLEVPPPHRDYFNTVAGNGMRRQVGSLVGKPQVLDTSLPLQRNGAPFLYAHIGVRSTLLRNVLEPWLRQEALVSAIALLCSLVAAFLLASAALQPIERISRRLEALSAETQAASSASEQASAPADAPRDIVQTADTALARIDEQIRTSARRNTELATNLTQMLQTLKDGVVLLTAGGLIVTASDSVQRFLSEGCTVTAGTPVQQAFPAETNLGRLVQSALGKREALPTTRLTLEDGRDIDVSLSFPGAAAIGAASGAIAASLYGAMLTLHDAAAQQELERELDLGRRLASIGRLTAGVGHEVKNPINAMVLHLELLRGKLSGAEDNGATRHVDVLASEMARLDRVVQTLADFTKPIEPALREQPLRPIIDAVLQLVSVDAEARNIRIHLADSSSSAAVIVDSELFRQALLNILLNAMDAMPGGGELALSLQRERQTVAIGIRDTGHGISPDLFDRIFHLYFTTKASGSGIGLAMTWRIVQTLGGTIDVQSETDPAAPTHGTLFTVRLPLSSVYLPESRRTAARA